MPLSRRIATEFAGLALLFLVLICVTWAALLVFFPGADHGAPFYLGASLACLAELAVFANVAYSRLAGSGSPAGVTATRLQIHAWLGIWFLLTLSASLIMARLTPADGLLAARIIVVLVVLTLLLFAALWLLCVRSQEIEQSDARLDQQRQQFRSFAPRIDAAMRTVDALGREHAEHAVAADRLRMKLDTVRSALESLAVSERTAAQDRPEPHGADGVLERQVGKLVYLASSAPAVSAKRIPKLLHDLAEQASAILITLNDRERAVTE